MSGLFRGRDDPDGEGGPPRPRPMQPLDRRRMRSGFPAQAIPSLRDDEADDFEDELEADADDLAEAPAEEAGPTHLTRQDLDPIYGYVLAMALSVGLTPLGDNVRYVVLWAFLTLMGGTASVLGSRVRLKTDDPVGLLWGLFLGGISGGALVLVGGDTLAVTSERLFGATRADNPLLVTWVFQATVFVMPIAETLFFRGALQRVHSFLTVALLASLWSILLFFPALDLANSPAVAVVYGITLVLLNFLYGYVCLRYGLAASLLCQVTAGTLLLLVPMVVAL